MTETTDKELDALLEQHIGNPETDPDLVDTITALRTKLKATEADRQKIDAKAQELFERVQVAEALNNINRHVIDQQETLLKEAKAVTQEQLREAAEQLRVGYQNDYAYESILRTISKDLGLTIVESEKWECGCPWQLYKNGSVIKCRKKGKDVPTRCLIGGDDG